MKLLQTTVYIYNYIIQINIIIYMHSYILNIYYVIMCNVGRRDLADMYAQP